jgi:CMP/dCMP kinase
MYANPMIITLTGLPGAGKSTIATLLSKELDMPWYSIGDLRGKMAEDRGMTIDEFNALGEQEDFTDKDVDDYQTKLGQTETNFIMDGRLSWHFIPSSFKVFLNVDEEHAAERIFHASKEGLRPDEDPYESAQEVKEAIKARLASDQKRYHKYYSINYLERSNYDLVIDTSTKTPEEIVKIIKEASSR